MDAKLKQSVSNTDTFSEEDIINEQASETSEEEKQVYLFENQPYHYAVGLHLKEDPFDIEVFHISMVETSTLRQADMERTLRTMQVDKQQDIDQEKLRVCTKQVEHSWITAIQTTKVNKGSLLIAHSNDNIQDKDEMASRLKSKGLAYVKEGIVMLN